MPDSAKTPRYATNPSALPVISIAHETPISPSGAVNSVSSICSGFRSWNINSVMIMKIIAGTGFTK